MTEFVISGKPQRSIKYDYPLEAIREIVINMVVHRDYRDSGNSIVKIFDNRIEFFNPGKLYDDITIEKLNTGEYASRTRNRAIARIFKEAGIIERYGSGIARIKNECKLHGIAEPVFEEFVHGFKVVIFKEKVKRKDVGVNVGANVGANELYDFIKSNQAVNISMLVEKFDAVTKRTIERWIKQLKDEGKIEFVGASKTGGYVVK